MTLFCHPPTEKEAFVARAASVHCPFEAVYKSEEGFRPDHPEWFLFVSLQVQGLRRTRPFYTAPPTFTPPSRDTTGPDVCPLGSTRLTRVEGRTRRTGLRSEKETLSVRTGRGFKEPPSVADRRVVRPLAFFGYRHCRVSVYGLTREVPEWPIPVRGPSVLCPVCLVDYKCLMTGVGHLPLCTESSASTYGSLVLMSSETTTIIGVWSVLPKEESRKRTLQPKSIFSISEHIGWTWYGTLSPQPWSVSFQIHRPTPRRTLGDFGGGVLKTSSFWARLTLTGTRPLGNNPSPPSNNPNCLSLTLLQPPPFTPCHGFSHLGSTCRVHLRQTRLCMNCPCKFLSWTW